MEKFNMQFCAFFLFVFGFLMSAQQASAQASLSVQGSLQNFNGSAVDNGQYDITFRLYTTETGGTPIWTEMQTVPVTNGVYSVHLGDVNPLNVPFDQTYYLGLTIPGGPEHTPRARLTSSPYALSLLGQDNKFPSTGLVKMESVATGQATTTATSYSVAADDHVIFLDHTANQNVTLPAATAANAGRHLVLVNKEGVAKTLTSSNYVDLAGGTSTTVPATGVVELQSDGSVWRQTGGYVQPAATVAKAYVYCRGASATTTVTSAGVKIPFAEISDAQNCWNSTTHTFTAPRTGIYRVSGVLPIVFSGTNTMRLSLTNLLADAIAFLSHESTGTTYHQIPFNIDYQMTAGQQLEVRCFSTLSSTVLIYNSSSTTVGHLTITEQ